MSIVNKIPKSEDGYGVRYTTENNTVYIISQNKKKVIFPQVYIKSVFNLLP